MKRIGLLLCTALLTFALMSTVAEAVEAPEQSKPVVREITFPDVVKPTPAPAHVDFDLAHLSCVTTTKEAKQERMEFIERRTDVTDDEYVLYDSEGSGSDEGNAGQMGADVSTDTGSADDPLPELVEPEPETPELETEWIYYGNCRITHYDDCEICCGYAGNTTASGVYPTPAHTVATGADLPFGTELMIDGQVYVVEDRGVDEYQVDIFVPTHDEALARGMYYTDVYVKGN